MIKQIKNILSGKTDFEKLFFTNEYQTLAGKSNQGIATLILIMLVTLLSLGFAIGGLKYLGERMDNPYTNWVNLPVTPSVDKVVGRIKENFAQQQTLDSFNLKNLEEYDIFFIKFIGEDKKIYNNSRCRTFDPNSDILRKILSKTDQNVIEGLQLDEKGSETLPSQCGLIVTEKFMKILQYDYKTTKKLPVAYDEKRNITIYLDIFSVVKELPDFCDYACTNLMYKLLTSSKTDTGFMDNNDGEKNIFSIISANGKEEEVTAEIKKIVGDTLVNKVSKEAFEIDTKKSSYKYDVILSNFFSADTISSFATKVCSKLNGLAYTKWECNSNAEGLDHPSYLSFNFIKLDKVRALNNYLKQNYAVELSMTQVEAKENFALVSKLTYFIIVVLFGFSITSIVYYVDSLLKTHLEKVKTNLGTFKAFGLSNKALITNYLKIIFGFLLISTLVSYLLAIIGSLFCKLLNIPMLLFDYRIFLAIFVLFAISLYKSRQSIQKILAKTPGDLIYNR